MTDLKPCPYCHKKPRFIITVTHGKSLIQCDNLLDDGTRCDARVETYTADNTEDDDVQRTLDTLIKCWNVWAEGMKQ